MLEQSNGTPLGREVCDTSYITGVKKCKRNLKLNRSLYKGFYEMGYDIGLNLSLLEQEFDALILPYILMLRKHW